MDQKDNTRCIICSLEQHTFSQLHGHVIAQHAMTIEQYYIKLIHGGIQPLCACSCGEPVTFFKNTRTFGKFKRGHVSRIKNNWGHNRHALDKSHQTMRKKRENGEHPAWNKGLSKETDDRVAAYGRSKSEHETDESRNRKREMMIQFWNEGRITPNCGPNHPNWKGGTSSLNAAVNADNHLYKEWKYPKLVAADFKCTRCNSEKDLCVHHDQERMATIMHLYVEKMGYDASTSSHELKLQVIHAIVEHHLCEEVSGVVLCYSCHEKEHARLNFRKGV